MGMLLSLGRAILRCYWWFARPVTLGVKILLVNSRGEILLVRHSYCPGWHLPGGGVSRRESTLRAAMRELFEETGIRPLDGSMKLAGVYYNRIDFKHDHVHLFACRAPDSCVIAVDRREIIEARFYSRDRIPDDASAATMRRIQEHFDGAPKSEEW